MHEFAHRLDGENFFMEGRPKLHTGACHHRWKRVMETAFEQFRADVASGMLTPLNPYAATNMAEFFACTTEAYFETPEMLSTHYPDVYERLLHFYGASPNR